MNVPTYEFRCRRCGSPFELFLLRLAKAEDKICPHCGSKDVEQGFGGGFITPISKDAGTSCAPRGGFG